MLRLLGLREDPRAHWPVMERVSMLDKLREEVKSLHDIADDLARALNGAEAVAKRKVVIPDGLKPAK